MERATVDRLGWFFRAPVKFVRYRLAMRKLARALGDFDRDVDTFEICDRNGNPIGR